MVAGLQTSSSEHREAMSSQIKAVPKQDPVTVEERMYDIQGGPKKVNPYVFLLIFRPNVRIFKSSFTGLKVIHTYV